MEYVSHVLPALGEDAVEQRAVDDLVDGIVSELRDPPAVAALKADVRMVEVLRRAAELRLAAEPRELAIRLEGSFIWVRSPEVRALLEAARAELGTTTAGRLRFRMSLLRRLYEEYGRVLGAAAFRSFEDVEKARAPERLPRQRAQGGVAVVRAGPARALAAHLARALAAAADGILDADEQELLHRRGRAWSDGDVAARRRGACDARCAAEGVRARDRRRGAGSDADAAADGRRAARTPAP